MLLGKRFNLYKETRVRMNVEMEKRLKKTISARVDEKVLETFSKQGLPLSQVVEAGIVHFLKLPEDQRISFIAENSAEVTSENEIVVSEIPWQEFVQQQLGTTRAKDMIELAILAKTIGSDFETTRKTVISGMTGKTGASNAEPSNKKITLGASASASAIASVAAGPLIGTAGVVVALAGMMMKNKNKNKK